MLIIVQFTLYNIKQVALQKRIEKYTTQKIHIYTLSSKKSGTLEIWKKITKFQMTITL